MIVEDSVIKVGIPLGFPHGIFSRSYRHLQLNFNLVAVKVDDEQIDLTWDDNYTDETGFKIERSTNQSTWALINTTNADAVSYSSIGLTAATKYYYRIRAFKGGTHTAYSNIANATTDA